MPINQDRREKRFRAQSIAMLVLLPVVGFVVAMLATNSPRVSKDEADSASAQCSYETNFFRRQQCTEQINRELLQADIARQDLRSQNAMASAAVGSLLATIAVGFVTAMGVYFVMLTLEETKQASAAAGTAADAAVKANEGFQLFSSLQSRAYVNLLQIDIKPLPSGDIHLQPIFKNFGQTPTRQGVLHIASWHGAELPEVPPFGFLDGASAPFPASLAPGQEMAFDGPTVSARNFASMAFRDHPGTAKQYFLIYGWFEYSDVFDHSRRHRTEFCNELIISSQFGVPIIYRYRLQRWGPHNGIDGECMKAPQTRLS